MILKPAAPVWVKWVIFVLLAAVWGSSFILMKKGLESFHPGHIGLLRISIAWVFTMVYAARSFSEYRKSDFVPLAIVGFFGNGIPYFLFPLAVQKMDSSVVGMLNSLVPLFTLAVGAVFFGRRFNKLQAAGVFAGLWGATLLLSPWNSGPAGNVVYGLFPILGTIMYAISVNTIGQKLAHLSPMGLTLLSFTIVGVPAIVLLFGATDFVAVMQNTPGAWRSLGFIAILGTLSSSISVVLFNKLIQMTSPIFASTITYFVPMVAVLWGAFDGERIGWFHLAGMVLILAGVYLVNKKRLAA